MPPTFAAVYCLAPTLAQLFTDPEVGIDLAGLIHGEQSFEWPAPVHPGDVIDATAEITSIDTKRGMTFVRIAMEATRPADLRGEPATRDLEEGGVEACRPGDEEWVRGHRVLSANECRIRAGRRKASGDGGERGSVGGEPAPVDAARCGSEIDAERLLKRRADRLLTWVRRLHVAVQRPSHDRTRREHRGVLARAVVVNRPWYAA